MYSRCQRISIFFSKLPQSICEAFSGNPEDYVRNMVIDLGNPNLRPRREPRNPVDGEILFRSGRIPARYFIVNQRSSLHSPALEAFIDARRRAEIKNNILSDEYDAKEHQLSCPILLDFPLIPVMFNGRLYDYDSLMQWTQGEFITDPSTREEIKLAPHVIQPHFSAQEQMNKLIVEMNNKKLQAPQI